MAKRRLPNVGRGFSRARQSLPEVSADDLDLFAREVAGDRPLARDAKERVRVAHLPAVARSAKVGPSEPRGFSPGDPPDDSPEELDSFVAPGVDRRELRKLRRGDYEPDVRIDLHGLMAKEAVARVTRVLDSGPGRRPRCLCVVHGRGLHSAGNVAVLKSRVRAVLCAHPAVLAFTDAPRTDGGQGAVYVLLRR
jgi:DNA-nicking Smr family endonuclease